MNHNVVQKREKHNRKCERFSRKSPKYLTNYELFFGNLDLKSGKSRESSLSYTLKNKLYVILRRVCGLCYLLTDINHSYCELKYS
ncbi:CLUMA_CG003574, isoform A [Clunio marinus]|uniref:CLUMA_CG003574, isoform A n=1 Tax=Clunio marinus TaxID=568069 RepID=A0A1J1HUG2_9DIPT|nr:CLUMA_CG003574, isoform A [Clunio marinus]